MWAPIFPPFGGKKNPGISNEEACEDLLSYTEEKAVNIILGQEIIARLLLSRGPSVA